MREVFEKRIAELEAELERLRRIEEAATKAWALIPVNHAAHDLLAEALRAVPFVASESGDGLEPIETGWAFRAEKPRSIREES